MGEAAHDESTGRDTVLSGSVYALQWWRSSRIATMVLTSTKIVHKRVYLKVSTYCLVDNVHC